MGSSGAIGALFAILLNVLLPLALAVGLRATDPFDFSAAICHGGGARTAAVNPAGTPADPSRGNGGHDCCAACLLPLAHALVPPQAGSATRPAPLPIVRRLDRNDTALRQSLPPPFRSRAPPNSA